MKSERASGVVAIHIADASDPVLKAFRIALQTPPLSTEDKAWFGEYFASCDPTMLHGRLERLRRIADELHVSWTERGELEESDGFRESQVLIYRRTVPTLAQLALAPTLRKLQLFGELQERRVGGDVLPAGVEFATFRRPSLVRTAEHAILLALAIRKRVPTLQKALRNGESIAGGGSGGVAYNWPGVPSILGLYQAKLGLVGIGEVGQYAALLGQAFGMDVRYTKRRRLDPAEERRLGVSMMTLPDLSAWADIISIHAPYNESTHHLIDRMLLAGVKEGSVLINTSRGGLVDETALIEALAVGPLIGAGLDVFEMEPLATDSPLIELENAFLTPHIAGGDKLLLLEECEDLITSAVGSTRGESEASLSTNL